MPTKKSPKKLLWLVLHLINFVKFGIFFITLQEHLGYGLIKALRPVSNVVTPLDSIKDEYDNKYEIFLILKNVMFLDVISCSY